MPLLGRVRTHVTGPPQRFVESVADAQALPFPPWSPSAVLDRLAAKIIVHAAAPAHEDSHTT